MAKLMYNPAEDVFTRRADLSLIETPAARGRFHRPYPFDEYVNEVEHALNRHGLEVLTEEYAVTKDNNRLFGMMEVAPIEGELITAKDWKMVVGLRGSHDQAVSRGISVGTQVMVCSNLCFSGNLGTFNTRQTTHISQRLPILIDDAVSRIPEVAGNQVKAFEAYKNYEFKSKVGDAALVEIYRRGGLTSAQLGKAIREWDKPSYDEHTEHGKTVWQLFNAATEALKPTGNRVNMEIVHDRSIIVSDFMNQVVGL